MPQPDALTFEREVLDSFQAALSTLPGVEFHALGFDDRAGRASIDGLGEITVQDQTTMLIIEAKMQVFPADIRNIIWKMQDYRRTHLDNRPAVLMIASNTISPGARKELQDAKVGYYDMSGSLFLPVPGAYVLIDRPMTQKQEKIVGSVFDGRRGQVVEALWEAQRDWRGVKAIAERVEMSASMVSETLQELERHDWVESRGNGPSKERRLSDWTGLLDAWTEHEKRRPAARTTTFYVPKMKPAQLIEAYDALAQRHGLTYEATGEIAGNLYAPHVTQVGVVRVRLVPHKAALTSLADLDAREVGDGYNLVLLTAGTKSLPFRERHDGIWCASPLRTYLDLLKSGGRGKDHARFLREQKLQLP